MKLSKKMDIIIFVLGMLVFGSISTQAANKIVYKQVKAGQSITHSGDTIDDDYNVSYTCYYFSLSSPGIVTFTLNDISWFCLYTSKNKPTIKNGSSYFADYQGSAKKLVYTLDKGTYYLQVYSKDGRIGKCKFKYRFKKAVFDKNYCASNAAKLGKNKTVHIAQTLKNHYFRWYKIVLKKRQAITYFTNNGEYVSIYDDDLIEVETERAGSESPKYFTTKKQPKGTYYVLVSFNKYEARRGNGYITFKWQ